MLTESVRDAADLYLSLKYKPTIFINDTPCGFVRHVRCHNLQVANALQGTREGCFETPTLNKPPSSVSKDSISISVTSTVKCVFSIVTSLEKIGLLILLLSFSPRDTSFLSSSHLNFKQQILLKNAHL